MNLSISCHQLDRKKAASQKMVGMDSNKCKQWLSNMHSMNKWWISMEICLQLMEIIGRELLNYLNYNILINHLELVNMVSFLSSICTWKKNIRPNKIKFNMNNKLSRICFNNKSCQQWMVKLPWSLMVQSQGTMLLSLKCYKVERWHFLKEIHNLFCLLVLHTIDNIIMSCLILTAIMLLLMVKLNN